MITAQTKETKTLELYQILELVGATNSRKEKIELLQKHKSAHLTDYCRCLFDDRVVFNLPEGKPPYEPAPDGGNPSTWRKENIKLQYIVKGLSGDKLLPLKRETIFIGMLESVHHKDAELIVDMINKKAPKGFTKKLVQEAYPNLIKS